MQLMSRLCRLLASGRFFDRSVRTVQEYYEKVEYIHLNPVRRGLVRHATSCLQPLPAPPFKLLYRLAPAA